MLDHLLRFARRPRSRLLCPSLLGTCLWSATAVAQPAELMDEPSARRADPRPIPEGLVEELADEAPPPSAAGGVAKTNVFFLNYDGVTIKFTGGADNAAQDVSQFQDFAMTYQPYGDGPKRAASLQALKSDWSKYDVVVTDTRPGGVYTMCVNSPTNPFGGGVLGIAPLDCGDNQASNIVFAYHHANDQFSAATQATTMSQEIAHAYGLEHVKEPNDIMNPFNAGGDPTFIDQCFTLDGGGIGIQCGAQHNQFCQGGQNSHKEMVWLFGLKEADPIPPTCAITFPADGQEFMQAPMDLTIQAEATDNQGDITQVELFVEGAASGVDTAQPYTWDGSFPEGTYCLTCKATDPSNNVGESVPVCFTVSKAGTSTSGTTTTSSGPTTDPPTTATSDEPFTGTGSGTGSGPGSEGGEESSGGEPGPDGGPALPPGYGQNDTEGCGCAEHRGPGGAGLLLLVALAALRRRPRGRT